MPTPVPTEIPTPVPTEVPTPVPTEVPTPTPAPEPLTRAGETAVINDSTVILAWYRDESGSVMISLKELAICAGWAYTPQVESTVLGHQVLASYGEDVIFALTVDDQPQTEYALVWRGDLYVDFAFIRLLGVDASLPGGVLTISFPQE